MKIDKSTSSLPSGISVESSGTQGKNKAAPEPARQQPASTSVSLGSTATQLSKMESAMSNTPVVDSAKVAEIKQAMSEGRFKVNSEVVADRLLNTVRDLIGSRA